MRDVAGARGRDKSRPYRTKTPLAGRVCLGLPPGAAGLECFAHAVGLRRHAARPICDPGRLRHQSEPPEVAVMTRRGKPAMRLHHRLAVALLGCVMLFVTGRASADDWPQWRGPNRDGVSKETGLLKKWPEGGPKLLWQVSDAGGGYSAPAVVGDRIYLISSKGETDEFVQARNRS